MVKIGFDGTRAFAGNKTGLGRHQLAILLLQIESGIVVIRRSLRRSYGYVI